MAHLAHEVAYGFLLSVEIKQHQVRCLFNDCVSGAFEIAEVVNVPKTQHQHGIAKCCPHLAQRVE